MIKKESKKSIRNGRILGNFFWYIRFRRKIIMKNLDIAFPEQNRKWKKKTGKRCFQSIASVLFEFLKLPDYFTSGKLNQILVIDKGANILEKYRNTGAVLISCHLGNWEIAGAMISALKCKLSVLAYRQKNEKVHRFMHKIRTSCGMDVIYHRNSIRPLFTKLKENEFIGFLADQNTTVERGIFVDFFGKEAIAVDLPAKLAIRTKKPILFFYACYNEDDGMYHMELEELKGPDELNKKENLEEIVRIYTEKIEETIRQHPECYLWFHKRWKTRPTHDSAVY